MHARDAGVDDSAARAGWVAASVSLLAHVLFYAAVAAAPEAVFDVRAADPVAVEVIEAPPEPPPAPAPPPPEEEEEEASVPPPKPAPPPPPPPAREPPPPPPPPAEETAVDFGNLTLTNEGKSSWAVAPSSGVEQAGPIGRAGEVTGRNREGVIGGAVGGTGDPNEGIVPAADLKRAPVSPTRLSELLERNYPRSARAQGIEGSAKVRVRLLADGTPRVLAIVAESHEGFGAACRKTLTEGPRWTPGLDRQGTPAATEILFNCNFEVR